LPTATIAPRATSIFDHRRCLHFWLAQVGQARTTCSAHRWPPFRQTSPFLSTRGLAGEGDSSSDGQTSAKKEFDAGKAHRLQPPSRRQPPPLLITAAAFICGELKSAKRAQLRGGCSAHRWPLFRQTSSFVATRGLAGEGDSSSGGQTSAKEEFDAGKA
ncbi:hypothetical protein Drorol1_Dr00000694, partial [Drosera rotundifolia]